MKGKASKDDIDEVIKIFTDLGRQDILHRQMGEYWNSNDFSHTGSEERFRVVLDRVHHSINLSDPPKLNDRTKYLLVVSRVAAILLVALLLNVLYRVTTSKVASRQTQPATLLTVSVPLCATSQLTLPDGTEVHLNSGSTLSYPVSFADTKERRIDLNGEAYFKVAEDKAKPFIVNTQTIDVKVLGTQFNIRCYDDESTLKIALCKGSIMYGDNTEKGFQEISKLNPGEVVTYSKASRKLTLSRSDNLLKHSAWTEGKMVFDNDPIEVVIDKFEKTYNVDIEIRDKEIYGYSFTATFINESLERALQIMCLSSPMSYRIISQPVKPGMGVIPQKVVVFKK